MTTTNEINIEDSTEFTEATITPVNELIAKAEKLKLTPIGKVTFDKELGIAKPTFIKGIKLKAAGAKSIVGKLGTAVFGSLASSKSHTSMYNLQFMENVVSEEWFAVVQIVNPLLEEGSIYYLEDVSALLEQRYAGARAAYELVKNKSIDVGSLYHTSIQETEPLVVSLLEIASYIKHFAG